MCCSGSGGAAFSLSLLAVMQQMVVLGHSMGGYISASYALQYPERVQALFLVSPFGLKHRVVGSGEVEDHKEQQPPDGPPSTPADAPAQAPAARKGDSENINQRIAKMPWWARAAAWGAQKIGPMTLARTMGPLGKVLLRASHADSSLPVARKHTHGSIGCVF